MAAQIYAWAQENSSEEYCTWGYGELAPVGESEDRMDYLFSDANQVIVSNLGTEAYILLATSIGNDDGCKMVGFTQGAAQSN